MNLLNIPFCYHTLFFRLTPDILYKNIQIITGRFIYSNLVKIYFCSTSNHDILPCMYVDFNQNIPKRLAQSYRYTTILGFLLCEKNYETNCPCTERMI